METSETLIEVKNVCQEFHLTKASCSPFVLKRKACKRR